MNNLANQNILQMSPYVPPLDGRTDFEGELLDFNERTLPVSPKAIKAINDFLRRKQVQVYPEYKNLAERIADYAKVNPEQVMTTNGSDQGIDLIFRTFTKPGDKVIIPSPSFAMFYQCAFIMENQILMPNYKKTEAAFPLKEVLELIDDKVKLIVICNPNNPTGTLISTNEIEKIVQKATKAIVYVDEAYYEFSGVTAAPLIKKYPNIIITRTFSKAFGLASLRIGYVIAQKQYIEELSKVRGPYDVNMAGYCAATAALEDKFYMRKFADEVMQKAKPMVENFFRINKIPFYSSGANFILFKPQNAKITFEKLLKNGIRTRPQNKPTIEDTLRVTIGTRKQMRRFIKAMEEILPQKYAFLDRDGALIFEPPDTFQIDSLEKLKKLPGVISGLKKLQKARYKFILVSNQNGVGTPSFPQEAFSAPQNEMLRIFREAGICFSKIFICPHFPEDNCDCRKPKIGLVQPWFSDNLEKIDLTNSFMYGDRETDRQFAENLGIRFIKAETNGKFNIVTRRGSKF